MRPLFFVLLIVISFFSDAVAQYHVDISPLDSNVYLYTSHGDVGEYKGIDANAVVVVSGNDALLFDTPWDEVQAEELLTWIKDSLKKNVLLSIITHAHVDRIGSIAVMHKHGIPTWCYKKTVTEATRLNYPVPQHVFYATDTTFVCGNIEVIAYYPGAGHTTDNIVLYVPSKKLLYGGCFIKSGYSQTIGNIEDADVKAWPGSLEKMRQRFKRTGIKTVIPGHGGWDRRDAIENTARLLKTGNK